MLLGTDYVYPRTTNKILRAFLKSKYAALMANIEKFKELSADDEKALTAAVEDFKKNGAY